MLDFILWSNNSFKQNGLLLFRTKFLYLSFSMIWVEVFQPSLPTQHLFPNNN